MFNLLFSWNKYGFEYEYPDSHNKAEIISKKERVLLNYQNPFFIGSTANEELLKEAAGQDFVRHRGVQLKRWLDEQLTKPAIVTQVDKQENGLIISDCLQFEAL